MQNAYHQVGLNRKSTLKINEKFYFEYLQYGPPIKRPSLK